MNMDFAEQVEEATHVLTSLWPPSAIEEVADDGIVTRLVGGEVAIISSADGGILWSGGRYLGLSWAVAYLVAAKKCAGDVQSRRRKDILGP